MPDNTKITMLKLLEYIFNRIQQKGHFVNILNIRQSILTLQLWNKLRWNICSITEEMLNDLCDSTDENRNKMIDMIIESTLKDK
jgi:hypothetical protein